MAIYELVRSPVYYNQKSGTRDAPDGYLDKLLAWRESARQEAIETARMNPEYDQIRTYIDYLEGRHWSANRPRYRSGFFDNRMADARREKLALLTDIRPTLDVTTVVPSYKDQAEVAKNVILYEWTKQDLDLKLISVVDHAQFGTGFWRIGAATPGMTLISAGGMDTVLPIQPGASLQDSTAILYRTYKPMQYFVNKWPEKSRGLERETVSSYWANTTNQYVRPGHIAEYTWNSLSPAMRYHLGSRVVRRTPMDKPNFPVIQLEEYWVDDPSFNDSASEVIVKDPDKSIDAHNYWYRVPPGKRLFPRKRLIVFAGNRVMYDGPSIFWHGLFPFAQLSLDPFVWGPGGLSAYRNQLPLNKSINEIGAGINDVVHKAINPQMLSKDNAVSDAAWNKFFPDMPGGRLRMTAMSNVMQDLRYMDPPNLPSYVFQFLESYLIQTFDRRSGRLDVTGLGRKNQVPGGDTIEQMRDTMQTQFRLESRYVETFLKDAGIQVVSNIFQFYTAAMRMRLLGPNGLTMADFDFDPSTMVPNTEPKEDHWRLFSMQVAQGSLHGAAKDRMKQVAISLFRMNGISRREMLRRLDFTDSDIDRVEEEIARERGAQVQPHATGKGQTPRLTRGQRNANPY